MRNLGLKSVVAAAAVVGALSGCHGCYHPPPSSTLTVAFTAPTNGQALTAADNTEPTQPGFHFNVVAVATDSSGSPVTLSNATLTVSPPGQTGTTNSNGQFSGPQVTFLNAALGTAMNVLTVTVTDNSNRQATAQIVVTVGTVTPTLTITSPTSGATLNASNNATPDGGSFSLGFSVSSTGLSGDMGVLSCPNDCGIPPTAFTLSASGTATINVPLSEAACEQTQVTCVATVTPPGGQQVISPSVTFSLDSVPPEVALYSPFGGTSSTQKFDVVAVVTCAEDGSPATLKQAGGSTLSGTVQNGVATFSGVTVSADGNYDYSLVVTDKGGNQTTTDVPVVVDSVTPVLTMAVTGASAGGVITTDADGNAANGVQADVVLTLDSEPVDAGVALWTTVNGNTGEPHRANTTQVGAHRQATIRVDLAEGANTLSAQATGVSGLTGNAPTLAVTVSTGRPVCRIDAPSDNAYFDLAGNPIAPQVEAAAGAVTLNLVDSTGAVKATATGTSTGSGIVALTPSSLTIPSDGAYHLLATCTGTGVSQNLPIGYSTASPTVTAKVRGDTSGTGTLGPSVVDTSPLPGMQIIIDAKTSAYARVSISGSGSGACASVVGAATADATGAAVLRDVTVPQTGACPLQITATDLYGNSKTLSLPLTLDFSQGTISITSPLPGSTLSPAPDAGTVTSVSVPFTFSFASPSGGGTLQVFVNAVQVASQGVLATDTSKTLGPFTLVSGSNVVRAVLTDSSGNSTCVVATYTVNLSGPGTISLVLPTAGKLIISNDDAPGTPGIQSQLSYVANPTGTNFSVAICSSQPVGTSASPCPDGNPQTTWFTLATNVAANVSQFTFPDGQYSIEAVLDDNGTFSNSNVVSLLVDSVRPNVLTATVPADTNGDGVLSASELAALGANPVAVVITAQNLGASGTACVNDKTTGFLYGCAPSGSLTIPLSSLPATQEASYNWVVNLTRSSGNPNNVTNGTPMDPLNTAAFLNFKIDTNLPLITISGPSKTVLGIADDADPAMAGYQVTVTALIPDLTSGDLTASGVTITGAGGGGVTPVGALQVSGTQASQEFTVNTAASPQMLTFTVTATDGAGNVGTQNLTVTVVQAAPTCTFTAPSSANNPYSTHNITVSVSVAGYNVDGQVAAITDSLNGGAAQPLGNLTISGGAGSRSFAFANGSHALGCSVMDGAGNTGTGAVSPITVAAPGCTVQFVAPANNPENFGSADDADKNTAGLQYVVKGTTPDCPLLQVQLCSAAPCASGTVYGTTNAGAAGTFSFPSITLADNTNGNLVLEMINLGVTSDTVLPYTIKLTPPVLSSVTPSQSTLYYVSNSNVNVISASPNPSYIVDLGGGPPYQPYATANFSFQVSNGKGGTAVVTYQGTAVGSAVPITTDPQTVTFNSAHLAQKSSGNLVFSAVDANNNTATVTENVAMVDVIPPAPFTADAGLANPRTATVNLTWSPTYDDWNQSSSGPPTGYDIRWSTGVVLPSGIPDDQTYFNVTAPQTRLVGLQPPSASSYVLTGIPPLNTYWIATRAVDGVGNYSPYEKTTQATYPQTVNEIDNFWTKVTLTDPGNGQGTYGNFMVSGADFNGDGADELVVTSFADGTTNEGTAWVYYGSKNGFADGGVVTVQGISPPNPQGGELFGIYLSVGNAGDYAAENLPDLLGGTAYFDSNRGRAFLFFGTPGGQVGSGTPGYVEFRAAKGSTGQFGYSVQLINDINGDGLDEVLIAAPKEGSTGNVYLFYGRSVAKWSALATSTEVGIPGSFIPSSAADAVFTGVNSVGDTAAYMSLGDVTGDGVNDFGIPDETSNELLLYSGATIPRDGGVVAPSAAFQTLSSPTGAGYAYDGFSGLKNVVGDPTKIDLVVSSTAEEKVYVYADATTSGFNIATPGSQTILAPTGDPNSFGYAIARGDFNGDGWVDLVIGESPPSMGSSGWVFYNKPDAGFDVQGGFVAPNTGFAQSRFSSTGYMGIAVAVGDFNGDGKPDLVISDQLAGSVFIWY